MTHAALMALSPLDGRYQTKLDAIRPIFSEFGLMKYRVRVEIEWLLVLTEAKLDELPSISQEAKTYLLTIANDFSTRDAERIKTIEAGINHDVKAVEYFLKERLQAQAELAKIVEFIHFGCTSEDINNLAYALMLQAAREETMLPSLDALLKTLRQLAHDHADCAMLARTHGQPASPTTMGKELANVIARLERQLSQFKALKLLGKMNGASGNYSALAFTYPNIAWQPLSQQLIKHLGLEFNPYTTQIEPHDYMAEYFMLVVRINTILLDLNRDLWGYIALNYFTQKALSHEVGSSTMPHKVNPIDFENAEGNLGLANSMLEHMALKLPISRWQRDLSDSTVLRNIGVALAHALLAYQSTLKGLHKLSVNKELMLADLNQHWEILAEPIQMVMRRYGIAEPYEKLKAFTRGHKMTANLMHDFIQAQDLSSAVKTHLLALKPQDYLGYALNLAKQI